MFPGISVPDRRPRPVAVAFWAQATVAALLVVMAATGVIGALRYPDVSGERPGYPLGAGVLLAGAAGLAAAAAGLRRGNRIAYRLSLAGLTLPVAVLAAGVLGVGVTYESSFGVVAYGDANDLIAWIALSATVTAAASAAATVLAVLAVALLASRPARRFFASG
ncbi:hypothetical protein ACQP2F_10995 [Actinoplanes sp. CA-030573]|uniref:hypothetical protein n=1 Tax=Actinoplanes sp. CA-030573 TaxID=3239898 RepID=UPI003D90ED0E